MTGQTTNGSDVVESVIQIASRLIAVLEREVEMLRGMKARGIADLQEDKERLVAQYEEQVRALSATPDLLREIAPALRAEFDVVAERFEQVMTENRRLLTAASTAQRRLFDAVMTAAEEQRSSYKAYSAGGTYMQEPRGNAAHARPLSLTLDRQL